MQYIDKQGQKSNIHSYIKHAQDFAQGVFTRGKVFSAIFLIIKFLFKVKIRVQHQIPAFYTSSKLSINHMAVLKTCRKSNTQN